MNAPTETRLAPTSCDPIPDELASAGKALAVWLFNIGAKSKAETTAAFAAHAEWWSA